MAMFGHEIPLRKTTLLQRVDQAEDSNPMATRLPLAARQAMLSKRLAAQQLRLDQQNEDKQNNTYQKGDIVWKRIMQKSGPGMKHALDHRYTGPFEIVDITNSSVTLDSPLAKFASTIKTHVDQLKPYCLSEDAQTSPAWDQMIRTDLNIPKDSVAMHTRKRTRSPQPSQDQNTAPKATRLQTSEADHPNAPDLPMTDQSAAQPGTPTREQELPASPAQTPSQPSPKSTPPSAEEPSPTSSENFCWDINNSPDTQKQHLDLPENPKADSSPMADSDSSSTNINIETQTPDVIMAEDASNPQTQSS